MNHVVLLESRSLLLSNKDSYERFGAHKKLFLVTETAQSKMEIITLPGFLNYLSDFLGAHEPIQNATGGPL